MGSSKASTKYASTRMVFSFRAHDAFDFLCEYTLFNAGECFPFRFPFHASDDPCRSQDIYIYSSVVVHIAHFCLIERLLRRVWSFEGYYWYVDGVNKGVKDHPDSTVTMGDTTD